jgi:cbb3-type cytochrome oxidase subunit 3
MDVFFNLALFVVVFYLITLYAGLPDRRNNRASESRGLRVADKRVA